MTRPARRGARSADEGAPASPHIASKGLLLRLTLLHALIGYALDHLLRDTTLIAPICLQTGLGLAAVLCYGWRGAVVPFGGTFINCLAITTGIGNKQLIGSMVFGSGIALQALVGAWLVRRFIGQALTLAEPRDVLRFLLLGGVVSTLICAITMLVALTSCYHFPFWDQLPGIGLDTWISSCAGVLIGTPISLALLAEPRGVWQPRITSVALPLGLAGVPARCC